MHWREENFPAIVAWNDDPVSSAFGHILPFDRLPLNFYPELFDWANRIGVDRSIELGNLISPRALAVNMFCPFTGIDAFSPSEPSGASMFSDFLTRETGMPVEASGSAHLVETQPGSSYPESVTMQFPVSAPRVASLILIPTFSERTLGRCPARGAACLNAKSMVKSDFSLCGLEDRPSEPGRGALQALVDRRRFSEAGACPFAADLFRVFRAAAGPATSKDASRSALVAVAFDERNRRIAETVSRFNSIVASTRKPPRPHGAVSLISYQKWYTHVARHDRGKYRLWMHWVYDRYFAVSGHDARHGRP